MMFSKKCPKCGMVQMPASNCKSCGVSLDVPAAPDAPAMPRRRRISAWYYILALAPIIVGNIILFSSLTGDFSGHAGIITSAFKFDPVAAPGKQDLTFAQPGSYVIVYDGNSQPLDSVSDVFNKTSLLQMTLKSKATGGEITLLRPQRIEWISQGEQQWISVREFTIDQAGVYEFSSRYPEGKEDTPLKLSVGRGFKGATEKFSKSAFGFTYKYVAIFLSSTAAALGVVLGVFLLRRREKKNFSR